MSWSGSAVTWGCLTAVAVSYHLILACAQSPSASSSHVPATPPKSHPTKLVKPTSVLIGARVRILVPQLGRGWRVGMFNQTREEPPCYLVLLMHPGPTRRIAATVPIGAVSRLQVSTLYPGNVNLDPDPAAASYDNESWTEVAVDPLKNTGRRCSSILTSEP